MLEAAHPRSGALFVSRAELVAAVTAAPPPGAATQRPFAYFAGVSLWMMPSSTAA